MHALFALSLALLAYTYAGYPLLVAAWARLRRRQPRRDPSWRPAVTVLIAARAEAAAGSSVGATGALWAMKRALWTPLPSGILLDGLYQPLCVARQGARVTVEPLARVRDAASPDPARELRRRTRTLAGNLQLVR